MSLFRIACGCGWARYRVAAGGMGVKCPDCGAASLACSPVPPDTEVTIIEPNGKASAWSWDLGRWIEQ